MKRPTLKQRFSYWLDNRMARGTASMIKVLALATLALILLVALAVTLLGLQEDGGFGDTVWDSFASTVNAWVFYSGDGSLGYVAVMALAAVAGLFVTSMLIGIVGSGIEEKLNRLRRGNSLVLESGHIVILGFNRQIYRVINELCLAAANRRSQCIVVMGKEDKETMEDSLREIADIPENVRVICRSGETCDPAALRCCAIPDSRTVIINEASDRDTVKTALAVSSLLNGCEGGENVRVVACVTKEKSVLPAEIAGEGRMDVLHVDEVISRLLAHTCRQSGISDVITDFFSFSGDEFYIESFPTLAGKTFGEAALSFKRTIPLGIYRDGEPELNPPRDEVLRPDDRLIILALDDNCSELLSEPAKPDESAISGGGASRRSRKRHIIVFGFNDKFELMARELNESLAKGSALEVAGLTDEGRAAVEQLAGEFPNLEIAVLDVDAEEREQLEALANSGADNVIILSDSEKEDEEADADTLLLLLQFRDIKRKNGLSFHLTTEMRSTANQQLARRDDVTDFIISSDIAGLLVAQVAECRELLPVFRDMLSNDGNEVYMKDADDFVAAGREVTTATLVEAAARRNAVFIGYRIRSAEGKFTTVNPPIDARVTLSENDSLIVLSRR